MASKHIVHGCNYLPPMPYLTPEQSQQHPVTHSTHTQTTSRTQAQNLIMKLILFHWKRNTQQATKERREQKTENRKQKAKQILNL